MVTTSQNVTTKFGQAFWEEEDMQSPNAEVLLVDSDAGTLVFNVDPYNDISFEVVNNGSVDCVIKPFVSNFADPGEANSDFGAASKWCQAKDLNGDDLAITVTCNGTPANNEVYHIAGNYRYLAFKCSNSISDIADAVDLALCLTHR